jgi:hypothetical protein
MLRRSQDAAALGAIFSALLAAKYQLSPSSRARRAFWVSPAVAYAASDAGGRARFVLSQRVVVVAQPSWPRPRFAVRGGEAALLGGEVASIDAGGAGRIARTLERQLLSSDRGLGLLRID